MKRALDVPAAVIYGFGIYFLTPYLAFDLRVLLAVALAPSLLVRMRCKS